MDSDKVKENMKDAIKLKHIKRNLRKDYWHSDMDL